jgi:hypothetical protein
MTEGTDDDIRAQKGAILDNRGWMYRRGHCRRYRFVRTISPRPSWR